MTGAQILFPTKHFTLQQLSDGVFAALATDGGAAVSNAGIVDLGGRTLVFDTMLTPQAAHDLRAAAQQLTGRDPELIVNSHYHNDHIWGNQVFRPQALFLSTRRTLELMKTAGVDEIRWAQEVSAPRLAEATQQYETEHDEQRRKDALLWMGYFGGLVEALPGLRVRFPEITFEHGLTIHGSSRSAELISFQNAHTEEDTILYLRDSGVIFAADLLFVNCHPYLDECTPSQLRAALQYMAGMDAAVYVPGHGPLGTSRDVQTNLDYVPACVKAAQAIAAQGDISPERIAREPVPEPFAAWGLRRFFTANLESLCAKQASDLGHQISDQILKSDV